ncbi:MAG: glutathione S-transferase family protein [Myxococcota bacterium]
MLHPAQDPVFKLYGAERSYFTGKLRPALRAKRLYFEEILLDPESAREIRERTGIMFIPVLRTPENDLWQDTSDILDLIEARFPKPALFPGSPVQAVVSSLLEIYGDEFMILPAMHYRWTKPEWEADARLAFAAGSGNKVAASVFADRMSGALPMLGVSEATIPAIVAHLDDLLARMETLLCDQDFLLGAQVSVGDCAMMGPFYGHLYLDLGPGQIVREQAHVAHWIERMNHPDPGSFAGFLAGDALHPSLRAILELIGRDAVPLLLDGVRAFESWADSHAASTREPPRAVGMHATQLRGVEFQRMASSYTLYMLQRPIDTYRALAEDDRKAVDRALAGTGCEPLLAYEPRHRLVKRDYQLAFADGLDAESRS